MNDSKQHVNTLVDHLFRHETGKLVAVLTRLFGLTNIELAEDIVQETLLTALDHWSVGNIPDNPAAWLTQVAKRKAINELKRQKTIRRHHEELWDEAQADIESIEEVFREKEIQDSLLKMIFTCCHPTLPIESQIALTLKTLCGFGIKEIARALLSNEPTINKRLYRAKQKIRTNQIPFDIPSGKELEQRLDAVCLTLYLLFNEGYNSLHPETIIRRNLCAEAIRLVKLLTESFPSDSRLYALLSLMCFHAARFEARVDREGAIVIFEEQDRTLWDQRLITSGIEYLGKTSLGDQLSEYHLEAGIAAEHCLAKSFEETDWNSIYHQYELLYQIKKNSIIKLNMAIVLSQLKSEEEALQMLEELVTDKELSQYYLLPATLGILNLKAKNFQQAQRYLREAKKMTKSNQEIDFLNRKLNDCQA